MVSHQVTPTSGERCALADTAEVHKDLKHYFSVGASINYFSVGTSVY